MRNSQKHPESTYLLNIIQPKSRLLQQHSCPLTDHLNTCTHTRVTVTALMHTYITEKIMCCYLIGTIRTTASHRLLLLLLLIFFIIIQCCKSAGVPGRNASAESICV